MRLPVNHMQGKIYINIIRYKPELCFECELQFVNCMLIKNRLYFTHKSLEGQLKH